MENILQLLTLKAHDTRLLGLDVGDKRIGLALSDTAWMIASPFDTVHRENFKSTAYTLQKIVKNFNIIALIVGLPKNMNGSEGPQAQSIRQFMENFQQYVDMPVYFWDERLTTVEAERSMLRGDLSRSKRHDRIDQIAASLILGNFLDYLRSQRS